MRTRSRLEIDAPSACRLHSSPACLHAQTWWWSKSVCLLHSNSHMNMQQCLWITLLQFTWTNAWDFKKTNSRTSDSLFVMIWWGQIQGARSWSHIKQSNKLLDATVLLLLKTEYKLQDGHYERLFDWSNIGHFFFKEKKTKKQMRCLL